MGNLLKTLADTEVPSDPEKVAEVAPDLDLPTKLALQDADNDLLQQTNLSTDMTDNLGPGLPGEETGVDDMPSPLNTKPTPKQR